MDRTRESYLPPASRPLQCLRTTEKADPLFANAYSAACTRRLPLRSRRALLRCRSCLACGPLRMRKCTLGMGQRNIADGSGNDLPILQESAAGSPSQVDRFNIITRYLLYHSVRGRRTSELSRSPLTLRGSVGVPFFSLYTF